MPLMYEFSCNRPRDTSFRHRIFGHEDTLTTDEILSRISKMILQLLNGISQKDKKKQPEEANRNSLVASIKELRMGEKTAHRR